ncbi:AsmA-like C-terminal region-containing protein [Gluconacetobacter sacchari]|uniref:AsmA-like C-terminal region-containing protein n=1 Tax=Gluconacetobacter sacchari TaxID=92759 RepID=UPI0039B3EC5B
MTRGQGPLPSGSRRWRRILSAVAAGCVIVPVLALSGLAAWLSWRPVDVTPLARLALARAMPPGAAGRLELGRMRVGWDWLHRGLAAPLEVTAEELRLRRADGGVAERVGALRLVLASGPLLHGRLVVPDLVMSGARLALRRRRDGAIGLDSGLASGGGTAGLPVDPRQMERLALDDVAVTLRDLASGRTWRAEGVTADLHAVRHGALFGLAGHAAATLAGPGLLASVRADGQADGAGLVWHVATTAVMPSALAPLMPGLAHVGLPVGLEGTISLAGGGGGLMARPVRARLRVRAGDGRIMTGAHGVIRVAGGMADLAADFTPAAGGGMMPGGAKVRLETLEAGILPSDRPAGVPGDTITLEARGTLDIASLAGPGAIAATVEGSIPALDFATLGGYWPEGAMKGARAWVTRNITHGAAHGLHVAIGLGSVAGWQGIAMRSMTGGVVGSDLELHWLRPIAPIRGVGAVLTFEGPDVLSIAFDGGVQTVAGGGRLAVGDGSMRIAGLQQKDQTGDIATTLRGALPDVLALLAEPRLHLLSRHPVAFDHPGGNARVRLHLVLPLDDKVSVDQIRLNGHADIDHLHLGNVVQGRALDDGRMALDATTEGLTMRGTALLGGMASELTYGMDFRGTPDVRATESAHALIHVTPESAARAGFDAGQRFRGSAELDVAYDRFPDRTGRVALNLDLAKAALTIPVWSKQMGQPAAASARLGLEDGRLVSVEAIHAAGPDLLIDGRATMGRGGARALVMRGFRVGRSRGDATVGVSPRPADPLRVTVHAPVLDLSPLLAPAPAAAPKPAGYHMPEAASGRVHGPPGRSWLIDADVRTLFYARDASLTGVRAHLEDNGVRLTRMRFSMAGPAPASATLTPERDGRHLWARVENLGLMLRAMGVTAQVEGGRAVMRGVFDDSQPTAPFAGVLTVEPIMVRQVPRMVRLANNASLYGWVQSVPAPGFAIRNVSLPFTFRDGVLAVHDGVASNASLGVTLQGPVDLDRGTLDLKGTIVPAFAVNTIPGHMPGVGRLMSPEKGGGLLAATFVVDGTLDSPALRVNPFSIFLPGVMRRLVE